LKHIPYPRFTILYTMLCLMVLVAEHFHLTWTYYLTKPMVLIVVLIFFRMQTGTGNNLFRNLMITGFAFSSAGDFLLMFTEQDGNFFIAGLIAFLITHICYTAGFITQIFSNRAWNQHWGQLAFSTLIVVYGAEFFILNRTSFGELTIPVMIYCLAITSMGVAAVMRDRNKYSNGYFKVLAGAMFFVVSDSLLATNKFIFTFDYSGTLILATYFFAQYFIATGCIADGTEKPKELQQ
jgi:uncharacterized membrane protein YhhN